MNYQNFLMVAEIKLKNNFDCILGEIKDCISHGSTGGEISSMLGKYLKDLEVKELSAYLLLQNDIKKYLEDCRKMGLEIL